jgi:DNA polymerase-3 subunit delta'
MKILGQDRALEILAGALRAGRFHHAWIFAGPRGVGKFTTAMQVARVLLDPDASDQRPNGDEFSPLAIQNPKSKVQNLIDAGTHPDLHIIRKELALYSDERSLRERKQLNIPIDLLRERLIGGKVGETYHDAPAYRSAAHGHGKVFIIDEAELLDHYGQNALLKTLEEPPPHTWLFLITTEPERLLPTIRSRCQTVRFGMLESAAMRQWVKSHPALSAQHSAFSPWVEQFAEGSPGIALLAIEYGFEHWQKRLDPMLRQLDSGQFPISMGETLAALIEEFAQAWVKSHKNASKDAANKDGAHHMLSLLAAHARRSLHESLQSTGSTERWGEIVNLLRECERQIDSNVNQKLALENLVVQWASVNSAVTAGSVS